MDNTLKVINQDQVKVCRNCRWHRRELRTFSSGGSSSTHDVWKEYVDVCALSMQTAREIHKMDVVTGSVSTTIVTGNKAVMKPSSSESSFHERLNASFDRVFPQTEEKEEKLPTCKQSREDESLCGISGKYFIPLSIKEIRKKNLKEKWYMDGLNLIRLGSVLVMLPLTIFFPWSIAWCVFLPVFCVVNCPSFKDALELYD